MVSEKNMSSNNYAIYFAGMDLNADLLRGAVKCIRLNTDLRCKIYVGVERKKLNIDGVIELGCAPGRQWTGRVKEHLRQISEEKIILLLEDYFICGIDENELNEVSSLMNCYNAGVVKLHAVPRPDYGIAGQPNLGIFLPGKKIGRVNTQPAIWEKTYLQELLYEDESLWEFEVNSAVRSNSLSLNVLGVYKHAITYDEVVKRGRFRNKYRRKYAEFLASENIMNNRGFLSVSNEILIEISHFFTKVTQPIGSQHIRTKLRSILGHQK